ncbi:hypothetical protein DFJ74DRAFT_774268 [Hyaloraphidium curvatum]|nr:hypothetical protein DFJ74DRAFT_774268 [Hyaloraphidium curvatum]
MSSSNTSKILASITGGHTNAELNLAGSGGFTDEDDVILLSISLRNLPKLDIIGTIDPYLRISSKKSATGNGWVQQYITEPINRNQNPDFPVIALNKARLTGGENKSQFLIEVLDKDIGAPKDDYVGLVTLSLEQIKVLPVTMTLVKTTGTTYEGDGLIIINSITEVKGKDAPGGATLDAAGAATASAVAAAQKAQADTQSAASQLAADAKAAGLNVPTGPISVSALVALTIVDAFCFGGLDWYPKVLLAQARAEGGDPSLLMVTVLPNVTMDNVPEGTLEALADQLERINRLGVGCIVRFAHEMNGPWHPYGQLPLAYVRAFRELHRLVHTRTNMTFGRPTGATAGTPGDREKLALDTNGDGRIDGESDPYMPYYPGDAHVDWIALYVYRFSIPFPPR